MEKDSRQFRQYQSPTSVAPETAIFYKHARPISGSHTPVISSIPGLDELLAIQANIEKLLPLADNRLRQFRKDAQFIEKWRKGREVSDKRKERLPDPDKKSGSKKEDTPKSNDRPHVNEEAIDQSFQFAKPSIGANGISESGSRKRKERDETDRVNAEEPSSLLAKSKKLDSEKIIDSRADTSPVDSAAATVIHRKTTTKDSSISKTDRREKDNGIFKSPAQKNHTQPPRNGHKTNQKPKVEPIEVDLIRVKSKDQIPIQTFWNAIEPYFKTLSENERELLLEEGDNVKPYLIPPLGRFYLDTWAEEERLLVPSFDTSPRHSRSPSVTSTHGTFESNNIHTERVRYLETLESFTEEHFAHYDLGCGTLTERLLSSLLQENVLTPAEINGSADNDDGLSSANEDLEAEETANDNTAGTVAEPIIDAPERIVNFEDRLKRELRYAGLLVEDDIDWDAREDDEVCAEMRKLQKELRDQVKVNTNRKRKLLKVVEGQLQYEQYKHILDGLDAQVEHSYLKRYQRVQKSKKKTVAMLPKATLSDNALYAMEKRRTWVNSIGAIFKDRSLVMPKTTIYEEKEPTKTEQDNANNSRVQS